MITVFPIRTAALFALVVFLLDAFCDQLNTMGYFTFASVEYQKVYVIRGSDVAQYTKPVSLARLKQPVLPSPPISSKLEQEFPPMAAVGDVPGVASKMKSIRARNPFLPKNLILGSKWGL